MAEPKSFPALERCINILTAVRPNTIELTEQACAELEKARELHRRVLSLIIVYTINPHGNYLLCKLCNEETTIKGAYSIHDAVHRERCPWAACQPGKELAK